MRGPASAPGTPGDATTKTARVSISYEDQRRFFNVDVGDSFPIRAVATDSFELYFSNVVNKDNHKPPKMMFSYLEHCHKGWLTYQGVPYKIQVIRPEPLHQPPQANAEDNEAQYPSPKRHKKEHLVAQKRLFQQFLGTIVGLDAQTDDQGETHLDLKDVGFISDQNQIASLRSRKRLWAEHPELEGRLVVFPFHEKLFKLTKEALNEGRPVCITGTPGVGKSVLRTLHVHSFLRHARKNNEFCRIILGKGGLDNCTILTHHSNGATLVEHGMASTELLKYTTVGGPRVGAPKQDEEYVLGLNCFVLVDVSQGLLGPYDTAGAGLVLYSLPNNSVIDHQVLKTNGCVLAYPLLDEEILLRYKNDEMEELYDKYGGLARLVWGSGVEEARHLSCLEDSLQDVEAFLRTTATENYLVGPHRFYYTKVNKDDGGEWVHEVDKSRPGVQPAPKHVMRIAAQKVVAHLLAPSAKSSFGLDHKTVSGVLFEEVSLVLLAEYKDSINVKVRTLTNSRLLSNAKLVEKGELLLNTDLTRKVVASASLPNEVANSTGGDLVVPETSNFPGLDAVLVLPTTTTRLDFWIYLQMTISLDHAVADGGVDMLASLSTMAPRKKWCKKQEALAFVVPDHLVKSFRKQDASSEGKQGSLDKIAQYVMSISIVR